jgi:hypothetical protein
MFRPHWVNQTTNGTAPFGLQILTDLRAHDFAHFPCLWHQARPDKIICTWSFVGLICFNQQHCGFFSQMYRSNIWNLYCTHRQFVSGTVQCAPVSMNMFIDDVKRDLLELTNIRRSGVEQWANLVQDWSALQMNGLSMTALQQTLFVWRTTLSDIPEQIAI